MARKPGSTPKRMGRPRTGKKTTVRIPKEDLGELARLAKLGATTTSELIRSAIRRYLDVVNPVEILQTVEIQASDAAGRIWQALTPADNVHAATPRDAALDVAYGQNIADGSGWRVCAWYGPNADIGARPDYVHYAEDEIDE